MCFFSGPSGMQSPAAQLASRPEASRRAYIDLKGGDLSDVAVFWLGDSHARRTFQAVEDSTLTAVAYAWLAIQPGWEDVLEDVISQVTACGGAPRMFLSLGGRSITVGRTDHSNVAEVFLEIAKRCVTVGIPVTIMELPFGTDQGTHEEIWRLSCVVRGLNTLLLGSSPAAGLMLKTVTTRTDRSAPLGLSADFPMRRDTTSLSDHVHLRTLHYREVAEATLKEFAESSSSDPKLAWVVDAGQVVTMATPVGILESWEEFQQGNKSASEVQLWTPDQLYKSPVQALQLQQQVLPAWQPWQGNQSGAGRAQRGRGGFRGRGGRRGRQPSWYGSRNDRRPQGNRTYIFN